MRHKIAAVIVGKDELSCKLYDNKVCFCASISKTHDFGLFDRMIWKDEKEHPITNRANMEILMFEKNINISNIIILKRLLLII